MKLCIDVDECKKQGIPIDTALYMASLYLGKVINNDTFQDVCSKGAIEFDGFDLRRQPVGAKITQTGVDIIETLFLNSEFKEPNSATDRFEELAKKLRELYPTGKKPGTNYMWRDSVSVIAKKLKALVKRTGATFTDEEAIEATKKYVEGFNGDYRYMKLLKYFISKQNYVDGSTEESSEFLSFIENKGCEETLQHDWTTQLR